MRTAIIFSILFSVVINAQIDNEGSGLSNLSRLGTISVTIGGDFIINGSFPALVTERVDQFISRIYNKAREEIFSTTNNQVLEELREDIEDYSLREITLRRSSGETLVLDLQKFRLNGDFINNPYLKNDDVIIFPPNDMDRNFFTVEGAVNLPGKFYFTGGDDLQDAIELSGGINKAYENVNEVNIYRLSYDGEKMEVIQTDISSREKLERGDRIIIVADETQRKEFSILVFGEVKRPGIIPITKSSTTLKTVLENAGGFTNEASIKRTKLLRGKNNIRFILEKEFDLDLEKLEEYLKGWPNPLLFEYEKNSMLRMSTLTEEDTVFFIVDEQLRHMINDATIDFSSVFDENSTSGNILVKDGDIIIVPPERLSVYIYGQVANPGLIDYSEGKDFRYYIEKAGGTGELAEDEDEIMIIKEESKAWVSAVENPFDIEPGDYIYIPKNPVRSFNYYLSQASNYISIIGGVATLILLVYQVSRN